MFHQRRSVKIPDDGTEGVGVSSVSSVSSVSRKGSGIEDSLCRLLCAGFLALALAVLAAPGAAAEAVDCTAEEVDRSAEEPCPCMGHYPRGPERDCIWDEYDSQEAGHPLRIAAYVLHPVGVIIDWVIFRPAWWVGSHEPFYTLFGRTD